MTSSIEGGARGFDGEDDLDVERTANNEADGGDSTLVERDPGDFADLPIGEAEGSGDSGDPDGADLVQAEPAIGEGSRQCIGTQCANLSNFHVDGVWIDAQTQMLHIDNMILPPVNFPFGDTVEFFTAFSMPARASERSTFPDCFHVLLM